MGVFTGESFCAPWIANFRKYSFSFNSVCVMNKVRSPVSALVTLVLQKSPLAMISACPKGKPGPKVPPRHSQDKRKLDKNLNFKFLSATNLELNRLNKITVFPNC